MDERDTRDFDGSRFEKGMVSSSGGVERGIVRLISPFVGRRRRVNFKLNPMHGGKDSIITTNKSTLINGGSGKELFQSFVLILTTFKA